MKIKPGFYKDMPMSDYHGHRESYSRSTLIEFAKTPAHCKAYRERKDEPRRDIFELGSAAHAAILEGIDAYLEQVAVIPNEVLGKNGARSTKAYKEWSRENADKYQLFDRQVDQVRDMYFAVFGKESFRLYMEGGMPEVSAFWEESSEGHTILMKCRPDKLPGKRIVFDLKTTGLSLADWPRHAANSKAHWSAYLTCRGLTTLTGELHNEYLFGVVETTPPHDCKVFRTPPILFDLARHQIEKILPRIIECDRTGVWPGSPDIVTDLEYPAWALKELPDEMLAAHEMVVF